MTKKTIDNLPSGFSKTQVRKIGYSYQVNREESETPIANSSFPTISNEPFLPELTNLSKSQGRISSTEDTVE